MMSKYLSLIYVVVLGLLLSACAYDDKGRARFKDRPGSLKDTHLNTSAVEKKAKKKRYAGSPKKKTKVRFASYKRPVVKKKKAQSKSVLGVDDGNNKQVPLEKVEEPVENKIVSGAQSEEALKKDNELALDDNNSSIKSNQISHSKVAENKTEIINKLEPKPAEEDITIHEPRIAMQIPHEAMKENNKTRGFNAGVLSENDNMVSSVVRVYYATDRNLSGKRRPKQYYGTRRSKITYGTCDVSIPKNHKVGMLEAPTLWRMEFRESEEKHVVLKNVKRASKTRFFEEVRKRVTISKGKNAFVFVHGYNIEFHEAALRTAQMAHDLNFDGVPIFYSWPSQGTYKGYLNDQANVSWTQSNLKRFMRDFASRSDAENIYLIAHSMGAKALTGAVAELVTEMPSFKKRFKEIMLAAPDIDAEVFKRDIAPKLVQASKNVTLYASADDKALLFSRTIHGQPRAGDAGDNLLIVDGVDTIDATGIDTSIFSHNYFAEVPKILADIAAIIRYGRRPHGRSGLLSVVASNGQYWAFRKKSTMTVKGSTSIGGEPLESVEH